MGGGDGRADQRGKLSEPDACMDQVFAYGHGREFRIVRKFAQRGISRLGSGLPHRRTRKAAMARAASSLHVHLRGWRKHKGLTLEAVADLIGSKINTISGWETGNRGVDLDDIKKLADAYGVHPAALLFAPDDKNGYEAVRSVMEVAASMSAESREAWLAIGRQLTVPDK